MDADLHGQIRLFEDNAEFGLGMRLTADKLNEMAKEYVTKLSTDIGVDLATALIEAVQKNEAEIYEQRERVKILKDKLASINKTGSKASVDYCR